MEPGTPPPQRYRHQGVPATPSTPRYGSFDDLPEVPGQQPAVYRKPGVILTSPAKHRSYLATPKSMVRHHSHPISALATPRQTPRQTLNRKPSVLPAVLAPATASFQADSPFNHLERDHELEEQTTSEEELENSPELDESLDDLLNDLSKDEENDGFRTPDRSTTTAAFLDENLLNIKRASPRQASHPHQPHPPPNVPGVWCVFRGRKVFRPFPANTKPLAPVTLFEDQLKSIQATAGGAGGAGHGNAEESVSAYPKEAKTVYNHAAHEGAAFDAAFADFENGIDSDYETDIEA